jgi:hypothetical protein
VSVSACCSGLPLAPAAMSLPDAWRGANCSRRRAMCVGGLNGLHPREFVALGSLAFEGWHRFLERFVGPRDRFERDTLTGRRFTFTECRFTSPLCVRDLPPRLAKGFETYETPRVHAPHMVAVADANVVQNKLRKMRSLWLLC